jgi:hypothetical protein
MNETVAWLLEGPSWVAYRTRLDLLGQSESDPDALAARRAMLDDPAIHALLAALADWPGRPLTRHNDAAHPLHELVFLADLGLRAGDPGLDAVLDRVLSFQSPEGAFQVIANISPRYGGTGQDQPAWMLCDAPSILYALVRFGLGQDPRVQKAAAHLAGLARENGWLCAVSAELGKFRGPGRKSDPCPYATLVALKALAALPEYRDGNACRQGAEVLLSLWVRRKESKPYLFGMGADFAKLKAPLIWYDILHVTDVLTRLPWIRDDARLREMADIVRVKADEQGRFTPESVWMAWRDWEFGQKKTPSRWVTLLALRVLGRMSA